MGRRARHLALAALSDPVPGAPALRLRDVSMTYGSGNARVRALDGVDLEASAGEFVVLLGPSGSGKTTLLNVVGGIEEPTGGSIEVGGVGIGSLQGDARTAYRRDRVGFVFQFFNLVPTLTAQENVEVIAELTGPDAARRGREALALVGLAGVAGRFPGQLSGGQQQRVAIARAIVKEPALLLCDEPTGSLDLATGRQVLAVLRSLTREGHHTVVLVTHNSAIAAMADRVVWLNSGRITREQGNRDPAEAEDLTW